MSNKSEIRNLQSLRDRFQPVGLPGRRVGPSGPEAPIRHWQLVVVGASNGGFSALKTLLAALPKDFPLPVAIVQHRISNSDDGLQKAMQKYSPMPVVEVEDKELRRGGQVYLAPADYHLLVDQDCFALSTEGSVCYARPSIDVLFESAADACRAGVLAIVLTGANRDGAAGTAAVKRRGGLVVVQDPATAEYPIMPQAAMVAAKIQYILPLEEIGPFIVEVVNSGS